MSKQRLKTLQRSCIFVVDKVFSISLHIMSSEELLPFFSDESAVDISCTEIWPLRIDCAGDFSKLALARVKKSFLTPLKARVEIRFECF